MADDGDGNLYLMSDAQIRKVDSQGTIRTVAGGGSASDEDADGMVATEVQVVPRGIAADSSGKLYFSDGLVISAQTPRSHIYSIETDATLKLIAGNGTSVSSGDGGPATQAGLNRPAPLVFGPTNDLYIATKAAIRRVSAGGGVISTFSDAIAILGGLSVDALGNLVTISQFGKRVIALDASGREAATLAGSETLSGFSGDGDSASLARVNRPEGPVVAPDGSIYFSNSENRRIRVIRPDGRINTAAGGDIGDGKPATEAFVSGKDLALDADGNLLIADWDRHRVRRVDTSSGTITTAAGTGELLRRCRVWASGHGCRSG